MTRVDDLQVLHGEIKGKKEKVENVQRDADTCASSIKVKSVKKAFLIPSLKYYISIAQVFAMCHTGSMLFFQDYELQLASYSAGLETLLNIPIKRTMLHSPASDIREEVNCHIW